MARLLDLDLGDIVGVDGVAFRSRRGELSLRVEDFELLAKSLRPPPGQVPRPAGRRDALSPPRARPHRQRGGARALPHARARSSPRCAPTSTRPASSRSRRRSCSRSTAARWRGRSPRTTTRSTATSTCASPTELYLKRLIVGGLERVYELGKDFRNEGISYKHNPEFTMVEWYEAYADYEDVMRRVEELLPRVAEAAGYDGEIDFTPPYRRVTLRDAIHEATGIDVLALRDRDALASAIAASGSEIPTDGLTWPELVDDLFSKVVEPTLVAADLRHRLPQGDLAAGQGPPLRARAGRALRGLRGRDGDRQRLHRAQRPRRAARPLRGPAALRRRGPRGGHAPRRGLPAGARARAAARPAGSASGSTGW